MKTKTITLTEEEIQLLPMLFCHAMTGFYKQVNEEIDCEAKGLFNRKEKLINDIRVALELKAKCGVR